MKWCRNCIHWQQSQTWKGNCRLHPWSKDKYSEDATAIGCDDYRDKQFDYQPILQTMGKALGGINEK